MARTGAQLTSEWITITQSMIDDFSRATLDRDPLHVDPEWCRTNGPFSTTIVFGAQTLALLVHFVNSLGGAPEGMVGFNYGYDRVRFITPVPVGSRIRAHFVEQERVPHRGGGVRTKMTATVEIEGRTKPALIAEWLFLTTPIVRSDESRDDVGSLG